MGRILGTNIDGSTTDYYDVNGNLIAVTDSTAASSNRSFINDAAGRALSILRTPN